MLANSLTREVSFKAGPVLLESLIKHFFDRIKDNKHAESDSSGVRLRQEDALYDGAFTVIKAFLNAASFHTVEELQGFSNTRTPSPPWVHVVRILIPLPSCEEAATNLIKALGGEEFARKIVGGIKWWQVRGINGVDAQWITAKKDWREDKKRHKTRQKQKNSAEPNVESTEQAAEPCVYEESMNEMRCILYLHGGGYYFGSVDQERYSIQRLARKINGRVLAINYRLAPQYPFPCGLQDALSAYLYLIRPPQGAAHCPVNPAHIIIAGDSAGGGLSLALLQVIRDSGLPSPAGGTLISPWTDLTHSFPSIHTNTETDVIPSFGLSFHKPSILWPPPSREISTHVHASLRHRILKTFRVLDTQKVEQSSVRFRQAPSRNLHAKTSELPVDVGEMVSLPPVDYRDLQTIRMKTHSGEMLEIDQQVQLYTQNGLLVHPLVSPALGYLGGLPPLLFIASDKEVLRDEIIYTAHMASDPGRFLPTDEVRALYPPYIDIEDRYGPTSVHLQVYDDAAHTLPVLFSFTTPAKFCFRAMATFSKFVTGIKVHIPPTCDSSSSVELSLSSPTNLISAHSSPSIQRSAAFVDNSDVRQPMVLSPQPRKSLRSSVQRALSYRIYNTGKIIRNRSSLPSGDNYAHPDIFSSPSNNQDFTASGDVGGPLFSTSPVSMTHHSERTAGDPSVYKFIQDYSAWNCPMIRERVSIQGIVRQLEPESELDAFQVPREIVGKVSELVVRRYLAGRVIFEKKFAQSKKLVEKNRKHNLERAQKATNKRMQTVEQTWEQGAEECPRKKEKIKAELMSSPTWAWAWAIDKEEQEQPPPSSIVSRRDTEEARKLAEVADQAILGDDHDHRISGNNLWSVIVDFLTVTTPSKQPQPQFKA